MTPCNNTSVGILVFRDGKLLLIERRKPPYGWAPPAGHVDDGESYIDAAHRELFEEVGLVANEMGLLLTARYGNQCRRPGGDFHHWQVFEAKCDGTLVRSEDETSAIRWVTRQGLNTLFGLTVSHLAMDSSPSEWQHHPGLEPVWMNMLRELNERGKVNTGIRHLGRGQVWINSKRQR
jgi:ADP-ribose pyrophosphatase YjhB (NUDIX family)